jgi:hypothetical protein
MVVVSFWLLTILQTVHAQESRPEGRQTCTGVSYSSIAASSSLSSTTETGFVTTFLATFFAVAFATTFLAAGFADFVPRTGRAFTQFVGVSFFTPGTIWYTRVDFRSPVAVTVYML